MLFNSLDFALFLPLVFVLYWYISNKNLPLQNTLVVAASYYFYGCWSWKFLSLIAISTAVDYAVGQGLKHTSTSYKRKLLLCTSLVVNLGFLGVFKYYNFFLANFIEAFSLFGHDLQATSLQIILPVGISFYTFQTLSYTIDVYNRKIEPATDIVAFSAFVCFFPQLVAGPIERASHLLPQFYQKRTFDYNKAVDGMRQILWGLFKKVVIADNCAEFADLIFNNSTQYSGAALVLGALCFTFQIYGDFSGYSDIAIGTSRLFGFDLKQNFAFPYFSRDIAEFWRRWHISLSTWFRDYLYIPLGGSRGGLLMKTKNTFIIFIVSGFWHGANWTFVAWGALNALYFLPLLLSKKNRTNLGTVAEGKFFPSLKELALMTCTFWLTVVAWIFFRAENISHALQYLHEMLGGLKYKWGYTQTAHLFVEKIGIALPILLGLFVLIEWLGRQDQYAIEKFPAKFSTPLRYSFYYALMLIIFWFGGKEQQFIYFQF